MSALIFLFLALVISGVGSLVLVLRNRRPSSVGSGVDEFQREMNALAPPGKSRRRRVPMDETLVRERPDVAAGGDGSGRSGQTLERPRSHMPDEPGQT